MHIDIWSDVVCPWCYIGKRRFETALESFDAPGGATVVHRSFQLDPSRPLGQTHNRRQMLMTKYRLSAQQVEAMDAQMEQRAGADGLEFHLRPEGVTGNTRLAHELVHLGRAQGVGDAVMERFFRAYFTEGRSVFDPESLVTLAAEAGLDPARIPPGARGGDLHRRRRRRGRAGAAPRCQRRAVLRHRLALRRLGRAVGRGVPRRPGPRRVGGGAGSAPRLTPPARYFVPAGRPASTLRVVSNVKVSDSRGMLVTNGPTTQPSPKGIPRVSDTASHWI